MEALKKKHQQQLQQAVSEAQMNETKVQQHFSIFSCFSQLLVRL